jgi:NADH-quinone oxidoreductase subunit B
VRFPAGAFTLWVQDVGLACCAVEVVAASLRAGAGTADESRPPDVLVVAGTLTDTMAPAIRRLYDELPDPKYVLSFGACADCGGPYWDSYCVTKGVDQLVPVDVYVPGCPPRPEALLDGLRLLESRLGGRPGARVEGRRGARVEGRPGARVEGRPGARVEGRPGDRPEGRPGARLESRPDGRIAGGLEAPRGAG